METYIGQIVLFPYNFTVRGFTPCNGDLLPISQYSALFSLIGTIYGGDGRTTFGVPDLRGRVPLGVGHGQGLSSYSLGAKDGLEQVPLSIAQLPAHAHNTVVNAADPLGRGVDPSTSPTNHYWAANGSYATGKNAKMAADAVVTDVTGNGEAHENRQPYLVLNYQMAVTGIFPSRP